jgi:natural product precursor
MKGGLVMAKEKTRIKIKDLSKNKKISKEEMKKVFGGYYMPMPAAMPGVAEVPPINSWPRPEDFPPVYWWKPSTK